VPVGKLEMKMKVRKNSVLWLQYITTNHYILFMPCVAANNIFMILLDAPGAYSGYPLLLLVKISSLSRAA